MGAMLVGMTTGFFAIAAIVVIKVFIAAVLFFVALKQKMNPVKWAIAGFLLDFWTVAAYIAVRIYILRRKCKACGAKIENTDGYCASCGEMTTKLNDGKIALKFVLFYFLGLNVIYIIGAITVTVISLFQQ